MFRQSVRAAAVAAATLSLAALSVSCTTPPKADSPTDGPTTTAPDTTGTPTGTAHTPPPASDEAPPADSTPRSASPSMPDERPDSIPPEKVRDAFAGLQATLNDSCTPENCAYFLGRVHDELHRLDRAMKADPKGPGHFLEPIDLIEKLDARLGGDRSFENLKKHQDLLIGTRDRINTWMQDHPDDYR